MSDLDWPWIILFRKPNTKNTINDSNLCLNFHSLSVKIEIWHHLTLGSILHPGWPWMTLSFFFNFTFRLLFWGIWWLVLAIVKTSYRSRQTFWAIKIGKMWLAWSAICSAVVAHSSRMRIKTSWVRFPEYLNTFLKWSLSADNHMY